MKGSVSSFPNIGVPKHETQSNAVDADGSGVIVGIFDTGVDPGAAGLSVTPDGRPKMVDLVDATGSGDVDCSSVRRLAEDGTLPGLSGRTLRPNPEWVNPSGDWHLGVKRAYELYPTGLKTRLKKERRKKHDAAHRSLVARAQAAVDAWDAAHKAAASITPQEKEERDSLQKQLEQLNALGSKFDDPGPIFDCIVWHDGEVWRAAVDSAEDGDLTKTVGMTDFRKERQYAHFTQQDMLNYSVNIFEGGDVLEIVVNAGSHGTHVAGIVGAYFPDQPDQCGVAPGCQIVSIKIGDSRVDSMETGTGLVRGLIAAKRAGCHIINMSYGEGCDLVNGGRFSDLATELINEFNVVFVSSAGNNGPALTTVGAPGGTTTAMIGVGAFVSPDMMHGEYSLREKMPAIQYTWSSRGPCIDGHAGVSISAPGGAIAPIPEYNLAKNQLMNGTSMSSPNAAGCVALLISALKAEGLSATPFEIKRALENTAKLLKGTDPLAQGCGVVQCVAALDWLKSHLSKGASPSWGVKLVAGDRGLYLRDPPYCDNPLERTVRVTATFPESHPNPEKVAFEAKVLLRSTQAWIKVPEVLLQPHGNRTFSVRVDPTALERGQHHIGEVYGLDAADPDAGPLFRLPVTVVRPLKAPSAGEPLLSWSQPLMRPGQIERRFVEPPPGATLATVKLTCKSDSHKRVVLHCLQLRKGLGYHKTEFQKWMMLSGAPSQEQTHSFPVVPGNSLEITIAQFWSSLGESDLQWSVEFRGFQSSASDTVHLHTSEQVTRLDVACPLAREKLEPSYVLNKVHKYVTPFAADQRQLPYRERDELWGERIVNELVLSYRFNVETPGDVAIRAPRISEVLYESALEAQCWMIFDSNKRLMGGGDALGRYKVKLPKGSFVARLQLRHDSAAILSKLKGLVVSVDLVCKDVPGTIHSTFNSAMLGQGKAGAVMVHRGDSKPLYVRAPAASALPKDAAPGDTISGTFYWNKKEVEAAKINVCLAVGPAEKAANPTDSPPKVDVPKAVESGKEEVDEPSAQEKLDRFLLDKKVDYLKGLLGKPEFQELAGPVLEANPDHLPLLSLALEHAEKTPAEHDGIIAAADAVIKAVDEDALARHYGVNLDPDDAAAKDARSAADARKNALVAALFAKGTALAAAQAPAQEQQANLAQLKQWATTSDTKTSELALKLYLARGLHGQALELLAKSASGSTGAAQKDALEQQRSIVRSLGWELWAEYLDKWAVLNYPQAYPLF